MMRKILSLLVFAVAAELSAEPFINVNVVAAGKGELFYDNSKLHLGEQLEAGFRFGATKRHAAKIAYQRYSWSTTWSYNYVNYGFAYSATPDFRDYYSGPVQGSARNSFTNDIVTIGYEYALSLGQKFDLVVSPEIGARFLSYKGQLHETVPAERREYRSFSKTSMTGVLTALVRWKIKPRMSIQGGAGGMCTDTGDPSVRLILGGSFSF